MKLQSLIIGLALTALAGVSASAEGSRQETKPIIPKGWEQIYAEWGFAPALRDGNIIYVSGIIVHPAGEGTYEEQYAAGIRRTFQTVEAMLKVEGASLDDIVEMTSFHTDLKRQLPVILPLRKELMNLPHPAWTAVGTTQLASDRGLTEIKFTVRLAD